MSLPVPLTVRVGERLITQEVQSLSFRKEAIGGVRSISFTLARPLSNLDGLDPLAKVYVYDGRSAVTVADGRLSDTGRSAGAGGEEWSCVAFGPAQHASDISAPYIVIDRSQSEGWKLMDSSSPAVTYSVTTQPDSSSETQGILLNFPTGTPVSVNSRVSVHYERIWHARQKVAAVHMFWTTAITDPTWLVEVVTRADGSHSSGEVAVSYAVTTMPGTGYALAVTNFPLGRNSFDVRLIWTGGAATTSGDNTWAWFHETAARAVLRNADGTEITGASYVAGYVYAHNVINDLLGHRLPQADGATASVSTAGTFQIEHMAYPDGVTVEQVLEDLMVMEPSHRWVMGPGTEAGYSFKWEQWPTAVRYEATLDDGGSFPLSSQSLYNEVFVRWHDVSDATRWAFRTLACPVLDEQGIIRRATLDLGSEVGTESQANRAGDTFLAEHNVPKNSGTLTVARPIRDIISGRPVQPWEIEPGELVRIKGVEAYPDAFNASTNDGQGVFRVFSVEYNSEGNSATLALDSDPREVEDALVALINQQSRPGKRSKR